MATAMVVMVKITKRALKSIDKDRKFIDDSMHTFMSKVKSITNSNPLTKASDSIDDLEVLTPNQFLIERRSNNLNIISGQAVDITLKRKWKVFPTATSMLWVKWIRKYLPTLAKRQECVTDRSNFRIGDLVILCDKNVKTATSPLGKVIQIFPGDDGVVFAVGVKIKDGTYVFAVSNLVLLEKR